MSKTALITGAGGQDGAYLAKFLLDKGYKVYGGIRRTSTSDFWRLRRLGIEHDVNIVSLELAEESNVARVIAKLQVDELYNLAAQSFVGASFEQPIYTAEIDAVGVCRILEAVRMASPQTNFTKPRRRRCLERWSRHRNPNAPRFTHGALTGWQKLYGHWITINYREAFDLFACSGILFNHESPLRGSEFVTRKATIALSEIKQGRSESLKLGNLNAKRDWGLRVIISGACG